MSEENVELVYRAVDAFNRRDFDAFLALADPDLEVDSIIVQLEGGGPFRGHAGVRGWWQNFLDVAPDFSPEVEEVRDLGGVTVARVHYGGHGIESDAPIDQTIWQVAEWRNGKCVRLRTFLGEPEALAAAGRRD